MIGHIFDWVCGYRMKIIRAIFRNDVHEDCPAWACHDDSLEGDTSAFRMSLMDQAV